MIDIGFYQLATRRPEAVLPPLVARALAAGHRILIHCPDPALLTRLDTALWTTPADSFVPHGIDSDLGDRAASQPVLLTAADPNTGAAANNPDCLIAVGGDLPDDLGGLARALFLFDADATETARARWRRLAKADNIRPVYWREGDDGRFEKAG